MRAHHPSSRPSRRPAFRSLAACAGVLALLTGAAWAQQEGKSGASPLRNRDWIVALAQTVTGATFRAASGTTLPYRLLPPPAAARAAAPGARLPLLLCLHAASGRSGRLTGIAPREPPTPPDVRFSASGG